MHNCSCGAGLQQLYSTCNPQVQKFLNNVTPKDAAEKSIYLPGSSRKVSHCNIVISLCLHLHVYLYKLLGNELFIFSIINNLVEELHYTLQVKQNPTFVLLQ